MQCIECDAQKAPENLYCSSCGRPFDWSGLPTAPVPEPHTHGGRLHSPDAQEPTTDTDPAAADARVGSTCDITSDPASPEFSAAPSLVVDAPEVDAFVSPDRASAESNAEPSDVVVDPVPPETCTPPEGPATDDGLLQAIAALEADPLLASLDEATPATSSVVARAPEPSVVELLSLDDQLITEGSIPQPWWTPRADAPDELPVAVASTHSSSVARADGAQASAASASQHWREAACTSEHARSAPASDALAHSAPSAPVTSPISATVATTNAPSPLTRPRRGAAPPRPHPPSARTASAPGTARVSQRPRFRAIEPTTREGFFVAAAVAILIGAPYAAWQWRAFPATGVVPQEPIASRALNTVLAPTLPSPPDVTAVYASSVTAQVTVPAGATVKKTVPPAVASSNTRQRDDTASRAGTQRQPAPKKARGNSMTSSETTRPEPTRDAIAAATIPVAVAPMAAPGSSSAGTLRTVPAPEDTRQVFEPTQVDVRPEITHKTTPRYPDSLKERAVDDVVIVRVLVSTTGSPRDVRVLRKSRVDAALDEAALAAVRQWTFAPARKRDQTVNCWMTVGVPFSRGRMDGTQ